MHSATPTLLVAEVLLCHGAGHQQLPHCRLDGHAKLVLFGADVKEKKAQEQEQQRGGVYYSSINHLLN